MKFNSKHIFTLHITNHVLKLTSVLSYTIECTYSRGFGLIYQRLSDDLGSGEFGVVRRGVWSVGGEEREVAVKTLADGSTEEKRIQFLQEAAIMSQFKHPSIITLHGVLMEREPVMDFVLIDTAYYIYPIIIMVCLSIEVGLECSCMLFT